MNDALELELRQVPGVSFVSFADGDDGSFIELVVRPGADHARVREEASRCVVNHLEGPADIRVYDLPVDGPEPVEPAVVEPEPRAGEAARVKLGLVLPSDGGSSIEVQLSWGAQRSSSRAVAGDTVAVGRAVLEALRGLGADPGFDIVGFHALPSDWGAGLLAVLRDPRTGQLRRGVASGRAPADAAARAVFHALNRSLAPRQEPAPSGEST